MHTLTRFERYCLLLVALILAVMLAVMIRRQEPERDSGVAANPDDTSTEGLRVDPRGSAEGAGDDLPDSRAESGPDVSARAISIPKPVSESGKPGATDAILASAGVSTQMIAGSVKTPRVFGTNEIMAALERVASMPWSPAAELLLQNTINKWATTDPSAALAYALQIESRRVRSSLVSGIFSNWAKTDVNGAYSWLMANKDSDPDTFRMGLKPVIAEMAGRSIPDAMRMASDMTSSYDRLYAMRVVVEAAARSGVAPSMVSYLDSLKTPLERGNYAAMLAQNWAVYEPQKAAEWASSLTDPALRKSTMSSAVGAWATDNPGAAAQWVMSLPEGELKSKQIAQVTQSWSRYDPVKAADFLLAQHPPSPGLDLAIQGLVGSVVKSNPEGAVMWAATISDPKARSSTIVAACREWVKADPQKASAYIATAPLTPSQRRSIMRR